VAPTVRMTPAHRPSRARFPIRALACTVAAVFVTVSLVFLVSPAARAARFAINFLPPVQTLCRHLEVTANAGISK
jgi:hypothetical protein